MIKINLFSKDKELILKITNGILIIWLLGALIFTGNSIVNLTVRKPDYSYKEYQTGYCSSKYEDEDEDDCMNMYDNYLLSEKDNIYYEKRSLYTSIINIVVVGSAILFLNRPKEKK
ncbi:MAG: hypothetical protein PHG03_05635 [Bacilli bacterium]|nr:hypothetical protein [Bacilli bacterium]MDD4796013.1 hypothetical protein [Bacilli bacterium]